MLVLYKSDKRAVLKIDKNDKSTFCISLDHGILLACRSHPSQLSVLV